MSLAEILDAVKGASPYLLAILVAATTLSKALQLGAHALDRWARKSRAKWDDRPARSLARFADRLAGFLEGLSRILPTLGLGPRRD